VGGGAIGTLAGAYMTFLRATHASDPFWLLKGKGTSTERGTAEMTWF
jgi:hypothetical protein